MFHWQCAKKFLVYVDRETAERGRCKKKKKKLKISTEHMI